MIVSIALLAVSHVQSVPGQLTQDQSLPAGSTLISKMLARYYNARTLDATIHSSQRAKDVEVTFDTHLWFEAPVRLRIDQTRKSSEPRSFQSVADGTTMQYDRPAGVFGRPIFRERQLNGSQVIPYRDVYAIVAPTLGERSSVMDILVARSDDLRILKSSWGPKFDTIGATKTASGGEAFLVRGTFRPTDLQNAKPIHRVEMVIDAEGNLYRYFTEQNFSIPNGGTITVVTTRDVNAIVDAPISGGTFSIK